MRGGRAGWAREGPWLLHSKQGVCPSRAWHVVLLQLQAAPSLAAASSPCRCPTCARRHRQRSTRPQAHTLTLWHRLGLAM